VEADAVVETEIDAEILDKATKVLAKRGLTVDEIVLRLCTRVARDGVIPEFLLPHESERQGK
jgi:antitoxin component of RelBE/YafQ-DinJ toxin-antitoxin module